MDNVTTAMLYRRKHRKVCYTEFANFQKKSRNMSKNPHTTLWT